MDKQNQWKILAITFIIISILLFSLHLWRDSFNSFFPSDENIPELKEIAPDGFGGECFSQGRNKGYSCYIYPHKKINGTITIGDADFLYEYLCWDKYNCFNWKTWRRLN